MNYYIEVITVSKAKTDVDSVFKALGYTNLTPMRKSVNPVSRFLIKLIGVVRILTNLKKGDILFLQYPMKKFYYISCSLAHFKGAKVATIIHDLDAFRRCKITAEREKHLMSKTDFLIAHNETMKKYLIEQDFKGYIHSLQIFDFLSSAQLKEYATPHTPWRIVYTSNLRRWRNAFIYALPDIMTNWELNLYGPGYEDADKAIEHVTYHGKLDEDRLMSEIEADFGLVWDGDSFDECSGDWGSYLKINNPHKTSLYLRAGIPVIIWSQAAIAEFVLGNNLGIAVDSLRDISTVLDKLSPDEYAVLKNNAVKMSRLIADGHFEKTAFKKAEEML